MEGKILTTNNKEFPDQLKNIPNPPKTLYCSGDISLMQEQSIAVVGTRRMTEYGKRVVQEMVECWVKCGLVIVSGLAMGIDAQAHRSCIEAGGKTIAIIPSHVSEIEPKVNKNLAMKIIDSKGLILSEHPRETQVYPHSFLERNRLISGLASAVIVIEAAQKSGALSTANHALEQGKEIFAVPGSIYWPYSAGTNSVIEQGAIPLYNPKQVLDSLNIRMPENNKITINLTENEKMVLTLIENSSTELDSIINLSNLKTQELLTIITSLEMKNLITRRGTNICPKI